MYKRNGKRRHVSIKNSVSQVSKETKKKDRNEIIRSLVFNQSMDSDTKVAMIQLVLDA